MTPRVRPLVALALLGLLLGWAVPGASQLGRTSPLPPAAPVETAPAPPHPSAELPCNNCHQGNHQGVVRMYLGTGGHGTPMIPSHMFQVRVQCVACHTIPKEREEVAGLVGQTFRPTEQACVACHGEKYRGMLVRWVTTLARMQEVVAPKLAAARAALGQGDPRDGKHGRARQLVDDAEFNARFVALGKGVHNVFYAADLLKLANGWLDQAVVTLGQRPPAGDDTLVRGGYCAVLCHEQAGVKQRETVAFGKQSLPHVRHVTEFGAVCTACHSAEVHKAVTATPETCTSCHHGAQNERCEGCHRAQSAFYRGQTPADGVPVRPNLMADAVPCTGCHDLASTRSRAAIREKCVGCHEPSYLPLLTEWTAGFARDEARTLTAVRHAESALGAARRAKRSTGDAEKLVKEARQAVSLVRRAGAAHNPLAADALLALARQKAEQADARLGKK